MDVRLVCGKCGAAAELDAESLSDTHRPACQRCGGRLQRQDGRDADENAVPEAPAVGGSRARRTRKIEEPEPFDADGFLWRAHDREKKGDLVGALADCDSALELEPDLAPVWLLRGATRARKGDARGAVSDLERFLALAPEHPQAERARRKLEELRGAR